MMRKLRIFGAVAVMAVLVGTFAVLSLLNSGPTAFANDSPVTICHYDGGKITGMGEHIKVHVAPSWEVIEVSSHGNAMASHLANHHNFHDAVTDDRDEVDVTGTACTDRDAAPAGFEHNEIIGAH